MWTPPPTYQSRVSTPALATPPRQRQPQQRLSYASTTVTTNTSGSGSSSRYSTQSFDFSVRSPSAPSILTNASSPQSIKDVDKERIVGIIEETTNEVEEEEDEEEDDSPVDPLQAHPSSSNSRYTTSAITPQPYLYFSPLDPITPPLSTSSRPPGPARTLSNTSTAASLYPYPFLDYGETSWSYQREVRNGGGTDTPKSDRTFRTTATDGSNEEEEGRRVQSVEVGEEESQGRRRQLGSIRLQLQISEKQQSRSSLASKRRNRNRHHRPFLLQSTLQVLSCLSSPLLLNPQMNPFDRLLLSFSHHLRLPVIQLVLKIHSLLPLRLSP